tara:strand:+ start:1731 stop:1934 length:204 start_codon:yes stop_codon:yes gene_type:complete
MKQSKIGVEFVGGVRRVVRKDLRYTESLGVKIKIEVETSELEEYKEGMDRSFSFPANVIAEAGNIRI